jgi:succinate dehydrogenase / fumarate reductase flavoprotein subunit
VEFNPGWHTSLDLINLLTVSEAITLSALDRKESRGAQFREDFPEKNPEFAKFNTVIKKSADGAMELTRVSLKEMPGELKQIIEEMG